MTARQAIVLFLIGFAIAIIGSLFKVQHWPSAGMLLVVSSAMQALALIFIAIKISRYPGFKDFLDN